MKSPSAETSIEVPTAFLTWQCRERQEVFETLLRGEMPRFCASHLPAVSTTNSEPEAFPIHSATKGVGLLPKEEILAEHVREIADCLAKCSGRPPRESLEDRIRTAQSLYQRPDRIDTRTLGTIEIFRGRTYRNLLVDPRATLLFVGLGPQYLSYQLNCTVEIVTPDDLRSRFIRGMRSLFEMERFHIQQPQYPLGYVFRVQEVFEKTPRMGQAGKRLAGGHVPTEDASQPGRLA